MVTKDDARHLGVSLLTIVSGDDPYLSDQLAKAGFDMAGFANVVSALEPIDAVQLTIAHRWMRDVQNAVTKLQNTLKLCDNEHWRRYDTWELKNEETIARNRNVAALRTLWRARPGCVR